MNRDPGEFGIEVELARMRWPGSESAAASVARARRVGQTWYLTPPTPYVDQAMPIDGYAGERLPVPFAFAEIIYVDLVASYWRLVAEALGDADSIAEAAYWHDKREAMRAEVAEAGWDWPE